MKLGEMSMLNKKLNLVLLFSLIAIAAHFYLTLHFNDLKYGSSEGSLCNISATFSCDATSASPYAHLFNIPIALFGAILNLIFFGWVLFSRLGWADDDEQLLRYAYYLSIPIALTSVVMGSISTLLLKSLCPFCLVTYFISFINFGLLWSSHRGIKLPFANDIQELFKKQKSVLIVFALTPVFAYVANDMIAGDHKQIDKNAKIRVNDWHGESVFQFSPEGLTLGNPATAKMHIVEFADFRCSHCKFAAPTLHAFVKARLNDVAFTFKSFPLDGTCNKAIQSGDGISCELAAMTFCAEKESKKGFTVHDYIFENQANISSMNKLDSLYSDIEKKFNLNSESLKKCATSQETLDYVQKMAQEGENAKVEGTPTVYINGKKLINGHFMPVLQEAYSSLKK